MTIKKYRRRHTAADASSARPYNSAAAADFPSEPPKAKAKAHHHESASNQLSQAMAPSAAMSQSECYTASLATALAIVHPTSLAAFAQGEEQQRLLDPDYERADDNPQPEADQVRLVRCNECFSEFVDLECMSLDWQPPSQQSGPLLWRCQLCSEIFYSLRRLSARRPPVKVLCFTLDSSACFRYRVAFPRTFEFQ